MATEIVVGHVKPGEDDAETPSQPVHSRSKRDPNRRVRFSPMVKVVRVIHLNDFEDHEIDDCYYTKNDFERIKADLKLTVRLMELGKLEEDTIEFCRRGTEYRTPQGARSRALNKEVARGALLDEQESQWEKDSFDPDALARIYHDSSKHCALEAYELGKRDEEEARQLDSKELPIMPEMEEKLETGLRTPLRVSKRESLRRRSITAYAA
jgi:hypothetical protein